MPGQPERTVASETIYKKLIGTLGSEVSLLCTVLASFPHEAATLSHTIQESNAEPLEAARQLPFFHILWQMTSLLTLIGALNEEQFSKTTAIKGIEGGIDPRTLQLLVHIADFNNPRLWVNLKNELTRSVVMTEQHREQLIALFPLVNQQYEHSFSVRSSLGEAASHQRIADKALQKAEEERHLVAGFQVQIFQALNIEVDRTE